MAPIQQYSYAVEKKCGRRGIDYRCHGLLYANMADIFCLIFSDSDVTRLIVCLREAGKMVIGMGERKTLKPCVNTCNAFIFLDECA